MIDISQNPKTKSAVEKLLAEENFVRLGEIMSRRMTFGTAGLRGVMAEGFACMNDLVIIQTSQGLAKYVVETNPEAKPRGAVISFDGRYNSARWVEFGKLSRIRLEQTQDGQYLSLEVLVSEPHCRLLIPL